MLGVRRLVAKRSVDAVSKRLVIGLHFCRSGWMQYTAIAETPAEAPQQHPAGCGSYGGLKLGSEHELDAARSTGSDRARVNDAGNPSEASAHSGRIAGKRTDAAGRDLEYRMVQEV